MIGSSYGIFNNWPSIIFLNFSIFNSYVYILQYLYSPTKNEIRKKYPSRLSNAEILQRAGNYVVNNYGLNEVNNIVGLTNSKPDNKKYDKMSD